MTTNLPFKRLMDNLSKTSIVKSKSINYKPVKERLLGGNIWSRSNSIKNSGLYFSKKKSSLL